MTMGRGGIFGNPPTYGGSLPDMGDPMFGNRPAGIDEAAMGQFPTQATKRKGGIFGGMNQNKWLMLAAVLGGGRNQLPLQFMMQQRQAEQERAQAEAQRETDFTDWQRRKQWEIENVPKAQSPYRFEDNAGNVHEIGPDGKPRLLYADPVPKMYIQGDRAIQIPNPFAAQRGPKPGDVVSGHKFKGGNPNDRNSWEPVATTQGASQGTMTRAQFQAFVDAVGQQAAQNHINKYGIRVAN